MTVTMGPYATAGWPGALQLSRAPGGGVAPLSNWFSAERRGAAINLRRRCLLIGQLGRASTRRVPWETRRTKTSRNPGFTDQEKKKRSEPYPERSQSRDHSIGALPTTPLGNWRGFACRLLPLAIGLSGLHLERQGFAEFLELIDSHAFEHQAMKLGCDLF